MGSPALLVSDVDNTVLGDEEALARFATWLEGMRGHVKLAYNSGRFYDSVMESVHAHNLPIPDAVIGGVGTQICFPPGSSSLESWPPDNGWSHHAVRAVLSAHKELDLQPDHLISEHKISCFGYNLPPRFLDHLRQQFRDLGYSVDVVYSSNRDLDVLPANVNKGTAAARLAAYWQLGHRAVVVAGDSGNDLAMFQLGFRGIVVANAHAELKALKGENIYHARLPYASGVLEGMQYWLNGMR